MIFLFLGVPSLWHKIIALVTGVIIVAIAYNLPYEKSKQSGNGSVFVENNNTNEES